MSTHLPLRSLRPARHQPILRFPAAVAAARPFSSALARQRQYPDAAGIRSHARNRQDKAPQVFQAEAMQGQDSMMDDLGLFTGTFIRGAPPSLAPSKFSSPAAWRQALRTRAAYEWKYLKTRFQDRVGRLYYFFGLTNWRWRERPRFKSKIARAAAVSLHQRMYKAFAKNDETALKNVCISGIYEQLMQRIAARPEDMKMTWELVSADRRPRVVSHKATKMPIPGEEDNKTAPTALRQVVYRLKTRQRLTITRREDAAATSSQPKPAKGRSPKWSPDGHRIREEKKVEPLVDVHEKDVVEYVVLQQRMLRGKMEGWKVWGFASPTTLEKIEKDRKYLDDTEAYQAANPGMI